MSFVKANPTIIGANGTGWTSRVIKAKMTPEGRLVVHITRDPNVGGTKLASNSTIEFRGQERTLDELLKYIQELEASLAEAYLTSVSDEASEDTK
jgi:hypothetical protein